jgi:hypothetical protein
MKTNDSKLLEKVLSKWKQIDKNRQDIDTSDCSNMGEVEENPECDEQFCLKHQNMYRAEVAEMIEAEARADTAKQIFDELEAMTLKASGTCNIPMCVYGDEAEEQYFKLKKKYNIEE